MADAARVALGHGLAAELREGDDAPPAPPAPAPRVRRWARNSHLWETCRCCDCAGRREGRVGAGYGEVTT